MRFSRPITTSRLRRPMSASTSTTFLPCRAIAVPRLAVVVVLPTPPLPDVTTMARPIRFPPVAALRALSVAGQLAQVRFDDDAAGRRVSDFGPARVCIRLARARDQSSNPNLLRRKPQGQDESVVGAAG